MFLLDDTLFILFMKYSIKLSVYKNMHVTSQSMIYLMQNNVLYWL
jgi:hypothetical protein